MSVLWSRGGSGLCLAVLLRVQDLPAHSGRECHGNRIMQRVLPAFAAVELPVHGTLLAEQSLGPACRAPRVPLTPRSATAALVRGADAGAARVEQGQPAVCDFSNCVDG